MVIHLSGTSNNKLDFFPFQKLFWSIIVRIDCSSEQYVSTIFETKYYSCLCFFLYILKFGLFEKDTKFEKIFHLKSDVTE